MGGRRLIIGVAHPWSDRKGLKDYITLSKILPANVQIVLVGLNEEQRKGLPENIIGMGVTQDFEELAMLYSKSDIVMNLSYAETFGLTTVEGFACGVPSIVYNATASPELVTEETGVVVEVGDIRGVANAVDTILKRGKSTYSKACRERVVMYFDKGKNFQEYLDLYEIVLNNKNDREI